MGMGFIVRDSNGRVYAAGSFFLDTCMDPVVVEIIAALRAVEYCHNRGFSNIILEGDLLQVVQSLSKIGFNWTRHGQIVEDIREIMRSFQDWLIVHTKWGVTLLPIFLLKWVFNMVPLKYGLIVFRIVSGGLFLQSLGLYFCRAFFAMLVF
jgi:hypothetical protein